MAKFRFSLETVLEQRGAVEREKQRVVAGLERARIALEDQLRALDEGLRACKSDWRDALAPLVPGAEAGAGAVSGGAIDLTGIRLRAGESFRLFVGAQRLALRIAGAHKRVEAARLDLLAATTARKAVEALRDRRFEEWKREQARRESAEMDEQAVMRAGLTDAGPWGALACARATSEGEPTRLEAER